MIGVQATHAAGTFTVSGGSFGSSVTLEGASVSGDLDLGDTLTVQTTAQSSLNSGTFADVDGLTSVLEGSFIVANGAALNGCW